MSVQLYCILFCSYVCSTTVISGAGMYRHTCESILSPSVFKAYVWASALIEWCSSLFSEPKCLHSIFVLNRPAVKNIAQHSCDIFSLTFSDLIWTLAWERKINNNEESFWEYRNDFLTDLVRIKRLEFPVDILMCRFDNLDRIGWRASDRLAQFVTGFQFRCEAECLGRLHKRFRILRAFPCHWY